MLCPPHDSVSRYIAQKGMSESATWHRVFFYFTDTFSFHLPNSGGGFTSRCGVFGNIGKQETMMSVSYGRIEALAFSGSAAGDIYIWKEIMLLKTVKAHDGPVFAMHALDKVSLSCHTHITTLALGSLTSAYLSWWFPCPPCVYLLFHFETCWD